MIRPWGLLLFFAFLAMPLCSQEVRDTIRPQVRIKNVRAYLNKNGHLMISPDIFDNGSTDNSSKITFTAEHTEFGCADVGEHPILITVRDESGNSVSAMALLTVADTIPPDILVHNQTINLGPTGRISPDPVLFDNGTTDACGISKMNIEPATFSCSDVGNRRVMFTVTDRNGNSSSEPVLAKIVDNTGPQIVLNNITVALDAEGKAIVDPSALDRGITDMCGIKNIMAEPLTFGCGNLGDNKVRVIVTDMNENKTTAEAVVTVVDRQPPDVIARDQTIALDKNGMAIVSVASVDAGSSDNCGIRSLVVEPSVFDCSHTGKNRIILTATDPGGNKASAEAFVIVEDTVPPVLNVEDLRLFIDREGKVTLPEDFIRKWSRDACDSSTVHLDVSSFGCSDTGTKEVLVTAADKYGNVTSKSLKVTIVDEIPPEVRTRNITLKLDKQGTATLEPDDINNGSTDNCSVGSMKINRQKFTREQLGDNEVELKVVDSSGNESTGKAIVTVKSE